MKSIKFIVGALAGAALLLTACQEEIPAGEDQSKPVPGDFRYDAENSTADALAFRWNAGQTVAAGATSYSIEVCDDPNDAVNMYDDVIQTIKASAVGADGVARATFTKSISEYTEKYVRLRVNYGSVFTPWIFATDSEGQPAVFVTGHGIKDLKKPSVEKIELSDCPEDGTEFTVKADLSAVASASRLIVLLVDYTTQKALVTEVIDPSATTVFERTYKDLTNGKLYQVKMLAEYDVTGEATHVAEWTLAEGDAINDEGETIKTSVIQCGKGFVFINGVPPTVRLASKLSGQLVFEWSEYGFENIAKDAAIPVKVALYKDKDCKDLVYGWTIPKYELKRSNVAIDLAAEKRQPKIAFSNLEPNTKYWFTCQDMESGLLSDALEAQTANFDIVKVGTNKVKAGEYALSENFSELYFGGYAMDFSPSPGNNGNTEAHPTIGTWDNANLVWTDGNHGFFNTLGKQGAVQTSRFKDWAIIHGLKDGTGASVPGDCCIRTGMFQMGASSGIPIVFTPELTNLEGLATVTLTFSASSMWEKGEIKEAGSADFKSIAVYTATGGQANKSKSTDYGTLTGAVVKEVAVLDRPATADGLPKVDDKSVPAWETKTVSIKNVAPGTRIGIGAVRPDGKTGNQRWLLNMVQVKVTSYGVPTLEIPSIKSKEINDISAKFVFEAQEMAQTYVLGYKKDGEKDYKFIEQETPEFNLTNLEMGTEYRIKAYVKAGDYQSDEFFYEFTTAVVIPDAPVIDQSATEVKATSVNLVWGAVENATSYIVSYKKSADADWTEVKASGASCLVKGLKDNTSYDFRVASVRSNKQSDFSAVASFTTPEISWEYPLSITDGETFASWITSGAEFTTAGNVINIDGNIDLTGKDFTPAAAFAGTLNGNNHSIKVAAATALFNSVSGSISNLTIEGTVTANLEVNSSVGHPLAALALVSTGNITNCTNKANVAMKSSGVLGSPVIAGLVAFQNGGTFSNNTNSGDITLTHGGTANASITGFNRKPFAVAAGVVGVIVNATAENCVNNGAVKVGCTNVPSIAARHYIGGVVGTPEDAVIKNCTNNGAVTGDFTDATKSAQKQVWVGGVVGGRNGDVKTVDGALIDGCKNYGTCTLIAENDANNYLAGIAGQATVEAKGDKYSSAESTFKKIVNSHNYGKLIKKGAGGCRLGGVSGGAATLDNCSNEGEIIVEGINGKGAVGGIVGYPTQAAHPITNCKNTGKLTSIAATAFAMGGIGGQGGNTNQSWSGCTVNCTISGQSANLVGMVIGTAKTLSKKTITLGTADAPIKVSGSINGTTITADNISKYISSDGVRDANGNIATAGGKDGKGTIAAANVVFGK